MSKRQWEHHSGQLGIIKRNNKQLNFLEQILSLLIKLVYRLPIVPPIGGLFIEETESSSSIGTEETPRDDGSHGSEFAVPLRLPQRTEDQARTVADESLSRASLRPNPRALEISLYPVFISSA